jgi:S-adenosylhomocysteine hydrolase
VAERKVKIKNPVTGEVVDAIDVPIEEARERWNEYTLEDGTVVRAKINLVSASRVPDMYDATGNPMYIMNATQSFAVVEAPERLRRKNG